MKLTVVSVGKDRSRLFEAGVQEYSARLAHYSKVQLVELPAARTSAERARTDEGQAILQRLSGRDVLVALDERGETFTSRSLASWLARHQSTGRDLAFAVGGDDGLSDEVRGRAALVLSLSAMTLPHRLARLVLLEQLYRAFTILRGEPYHRD